MRCWKSLNRPKRRAMQPLQMVSRSGEGWVGECWGMVRAGLGSGEGWVGECWGNGEGWVGEW